LLFSVFKSYIPRKIQNSFFQKAIISFFGLITLRFFLSSHFSRCHHATHSLRIITPQHSTHHSSHLLFFAPLSECRSWLECWFCCMDLFVLFEVLQPLHHFTQQHYVSLHDSHHYIRRFKSSHHDFLNWKCYI